MQNKKKFKRTIVDKIIFILLAVSMTIVFIWDIVKDFIPDEYWQLKLLIIVCGALSGFFTILSFFFDKKFLDVSNDIDVSNTKKAEDLIKSCNDKIEALNSNIKTFVEEDISSFESFNDAIAFIFKQKKQFDEVKIFAYSAKNYIDFLKRSKIKIRHLYLCLHRANDYSAWFVQNKERALKYQTELTGVLENLEQMKEDREILQCEIRFYDFESYSHFGIFDEVMVWGDLIPMFSDKKTVQIGKVQEMQKIGRNADFFKNKIIFFDNLFAESVMDSGLKMIQEGCHYCETSKMILDPHHINGTASRYGKCDISLLNETKKIEDFILEPDFHPISDLHMLLVCKFHILNLQDFVLSFQSPYRL